MPELPEVETVCRGLAKQMWSRKISGIRLNRKGLRTPFPKALTQIVNLSVTGITRRAKYILIHLDDARTLIVHLGMSGRMTISKNYIAEKHDHMILTLENGATVALNDARRFGVVDLCCTNALEQHKLFVHLGVEPLEKGFTSAYLSARLKGKKAPIKTVIMDQRLVVGVGNIYAAEALFMAGIHPERAATTLTLPEIKKLIASIRKVLNAAIKAGGSTLKDYAQADGELGYFQHSFAVYGRAGQGCKGCVCPLKKTGGVQKITQGGRSTFYCPHQQT